MSAQPTTTHIFKTAWRRLPGGIWALGFTSLFMDASSELIHSLLPIYMSTVLGASMVTIGAVEGLAEAIAHSTKVFSGFFSDYWRKRKALAVTGYGLAAATKPIFPLASSIGWVAAGRFLDRVGKGIRGAPRDALVADITPKELRGAAYGLRQAMDSVGAVLGPLLAVVFMLVFMGAIRSVLWIAVIPAVIAVTVLAAGVHEPDHLSAMPSKKFHFHDAARMGRRYWTVVGLGGVFGLARFSEAFLILRAENVGFSTSYTPLVMVVMNLVYSVGAYPAGAAADVGSARKFLLAGLGALIAADVMLAGASGAGWMIAGAAVWGLHMALTQGLFSKLVADTAPADLRGSAFGVFNLISGGAALVASVLAGVLWTAYGPATVFWASAGFAAVTAVGLMMSGSGRSRTS